MKLALISQSLCSIVLAGMLLTGCQSQKERETSSSEPNAGAEITTIYQLKVYKDDLDSTTISKREKQLEHILDSTFNSFRSIPKPQNLVTYFEQIPPEVLRYHDYSDSDDSYKEFMETIQLFQDYCDKGGEFPKEELLKMMAHIDDDITYLESHGCDPSLIVCHKILYLRFLQQMVRHCPDIQLLADKISDDKRVALIDNNWYPKNFFRERNPIFLKSTKGEWLVFLKEYFPPVQFVHKKIFGIDFYTFKTNYLTAGTITLKYNQEDWMEIK